MALYWKNPDPRKYVNIVPTSAISGEGIPDMLQLLVKLTQACAAPAAPGRSRKQRAPHASNFHMLASCAADLPVSGKTQHGGKAGCNMRGACSARLPLMQQRWYACCASAVRASAPAIRA